MEKLTLHLMTKNDGAELTLKPVNEESWEVYMSLMSIFGSIDKNGLTVNAVQVATTELKNRVSKFVNEYSSRFPVLQGFSKKIRDVPNGDYFLVLINRPVSTREKLDLELYLSALNEANDKSQIKEIYEQKRDGINELFNELLNLYEFNAPRTDKRINIGEARKNLRICRFCEGTVASGAKYTKVAHAIPEALGNKNLILYEECDGCNNFFGNQIEPSLVESLDILRAFLGLKGKKGLPTIVYKNGKIYSDSGQMVIEGQSIDGDPTQELKVNLHSSKKFTPIKFYKALCKIALSTIDSSEIDSLRETIMWARYGEHSTELVPRIAVNVIHSGFTKVPQIGLYTRKENSSNLPHVVGEFRLGSFVYVFILPFSKKDDVNFTDDKDFSKFWSTFKHYNLVKGWRFDDLNSHNEVMILSETIRLVKEKA